MFHQVLSSVLSTVFDLAFAILPAAPLFALKRLPPTPSRKSRVPPRLKIGAQQKLSRSHRGKA